MENIAKECGFESIEEMYSMISSVDLTNTETGLKFHDWKINDGTKEGLVKIIEGDG